MKSLATSSLAKNIIKFNLDQRLAKFLLQFRGSNQFGERVHSRPGHQVEIKDFRPYVPGDPTRDIDWKIWGKLEELHIRLREGTAKANLEIKIDASDSMKVVYSADSVSKWVAALTFSYTLGRFAIKSRDRIKLTINDNQFTVFSDSQLLDILMAIEQNSKQLTDRASRESNNYVVWISDFFIEPADIEAWIQRKISNSRHIIFVHIYDNLESTLSINGEKDIINPERDHQKRQIFSDQMFVNLDQIKTKYIENYKDHFNQIKHICHSYSIPWLSVAVTDDPIETIHRFMI